MFLGTGVTAMPPIHPIPYALDAPRHLPMNEETQDCDMYFLNQS